MSETQPKKLLIINILDILKKYTDEHHRISQKEIANILQKEYNMTAERRAIKRNLMMLLDFGYDLRYAKIQRINSKGVQETVYYDWYLKRDFSDLDLKLIIDGLLISNKAPADTRNNIIEKIKKLSNNYFHAATHICTPRENTLPVSRLFDNLELLEHSIQLGHPVSFCCNTYGADHQLHPVLNNDGSVQRLSVIPHTIAAVAGRYLLICSQPDHDNLFSYRIDLMSDILPDESFVPTKADTLYTLQSVCSLSDAIQPLEGELIRLQVRVTTRFLDELTERYGILPAVRRIDEEWSELSVVVNAHAAVSWALKYGSDVEVLQPESLRAQIRDAAKRIEKKYQ